jgi:hypothetical protein
MRSIEQTESVIQPARRQFLRGAGIGVLSAAAVGILAGSPALAATKVKSKASMENDASILNVALGLEWEGIGAYQLGAESGLLSKGVLPVAVMFQSHHKAHADTLVGAIKSLGGKPVEPKSSADYAKALNAASLKSEADVLTLAAKLEKGAANAYIGVIPSFTDSGLAQVSARLAADETMHWTVLAQALGMMLPKEALSFGA